MQPTLNRRWSARVEFAAHKLPQLPALIPGNNMNANEEGLPHRPEVDTKRASKVVAEALVVRGSAPPRIPQDDGSLFSAVGHNITA